MLIAKTAIITGITGQLGAILVQHDPNLFEHLNYLDINAKYNFDMLVKEMVESDLKLAKKEKLLKEHQ